MRIFYLHLMLLTGTLFLVSCEKDTAVTRSNTTLPPIINTTPPKVLAGQNIWIVMPLDSCKLSGLVAGPQQNGLSYLWRKVSGPASVNIKSPTHLQSIVSNLETGMYVFELSVTNNSGLTGKDSVEVFVQEAPLINQGLVIFNDLSWVCPMGCSFTIPCFDCYVPANHPFRIYLRSDDSNQWFEVIPENQWTEDVRYTYDINNNTLVIYTIHDEWDKRPDIMITY